MKLAGFQENEKPGKHQRGCHITYAAQGSSALGRLSDRQSSSFGEWEREIDV